MTGPYLRKKGIVTDRLVLLRANWSARGEELKYIKHLGDCDSDCSSTKIVMTEQNAEHPTSGRRRRYKRPPVLHDTSALPVPRLADHIDTESGPSEEEGEEEAKRQRSEPTTPISTSSRLPYEYDEVMGITQVSSREAERFEEDLGLEHHDASEDPSVPETPKLVPTPAFPHGGCGSSSLRECTELLNNTGSNAPATLHSGVKKEKTSDPPQVMSPNVDEKETKAHATVSSSMPSDTLAVKDEPQTRTEQVKAEVPIPKLESPMLDVKEEVSETETQEQLPDILPEEIRGNRELPPHDSEDSLSPECVADELRRLAEAQSTSNAPNESSEEWSHSFSFHLKLTRSDSSRFLLGLGKLWSLRTSEIRKTSR